MSQPSASVTETTDNGFHPAHQHYITDWVHRRRQLPTDHAYRRSDDQRFTLDPVDRGKCFGLNVMIRTFAVPMMASLAKIAKNSSPKRRCNDGVNCVGLIDAPDVAPSMMLRPRCSWKLCRGAMLIGQACQDVVRETIEPIGAPSWRRSNGMLKMLSTRRREREVIGKDVRNTTGGT